MDLRFAPEDQKFADEFRAFLDANLPVEKQIGDEAAPEPDPEFQKEFLKVMGKHGWLVPAWPVEYGGRGATFMQQLIFHEIVGYYRAPMSIAINTIQLLGPTLILYGTDEQKAQHLPPIARGEIWWAQGFSEPGAGSDLASLETKAEIDGDDFVINGSKIWTSEGHHCQWAFIICRTDPNAPKHRGISFILADMSSPGFHLRPLMDMTDRHYFNQIYFENLRVPKKNLVGELNRGWYVAMALLDLERSGVDRVGNLLRFVDEIIAYTTTETRDGKPLIKGPIIAAKMAEAKIESEVARWLSYRVGVMQANGQIPNHESSQAKLFASEVAQRVDQWALETLGPKGHIRAQTQKYVQLKGRPLVASLYDVSATIAGGSSEIQRSIIATRGLGLPRG